MSCDGSMELKPLGFPHASTYVTGNIPSVSGIDNTDALMIAYKQVVMT